MKKETLNQKIIDRLVNYYNFKREHYCDNKDYILKIDHYGMVKINISYACVSIDLINMVGTIPLAHRYDCTKVSDIDFLLKKNSRIADFLN